MSLGVLAALGVVLAAVCAMAVWLFRRRPAPARSREWAIHLFLAAATLAGSWWALEIYFYFQPESDQFGMTLAARRWLERHWHPVNSRGFRDVEHPPPELRGKRVALVVGDSFAAGYGVETVEQRFAGVLQEGLGPRWRVVTLAKNGWDTPDELEALQRFPHPVEVVVLSYFVDDILPAARAEGFREPFLFEAPPRWLQLILRSSYLVNFYYWRLYRYRDVAQLTRVRRDSLDQAFANALVWGRHAAELERVASWARGRGARLVAVCFPHLADRDGTRSYADQVAAHLRSLGAGVVDVGALTAGRPTRELVVNRLDAHPSPALHRDVAGWVRGHILATPPRVP